MQGFVRWFSLCLLTTVIYTGQSNGFIVTDEERVNAPPADCGKACAVVKRQLDHEMLAEEREVYEAMLAAGLREPLSDTDLLHCDLEIEIKPGQTENLSGTNTMTIQSKSSALTTFTFRLAGQYVISSATVNGGTPVTVNKPSNTTRVVTLDRTYGMDETFTLTISYSGHAQSSAFGSIEFDTHSGTNLVSTLSEAYFAYTWWPVKDGDLYESGDNSDKFTLDIAVISPGTMITAANGVFVGEDYLSGQRVRQRWSSDYPIAAYLVCFSSTNYNTWEETYVPLAGGSMPVVFYIYPEHDTTSNRNAWNKVVDMLYVFRDLYGEYPFVNEKYGIYEFEFGGGMEHQTFTGQGTFSENTTAHELAHQWWGDMVTCKNWNDIWINEGFARYSEAIWNEFKPGSSGAAARKSYMTGIKYTGAGSVYVTAAEVGDMNDIFDVTTTYNKAGWVVHMLRGVLGEEQFWNALAGYRVAFEYSAADTDDLKGVFEDYYGGESLDWFFQEWIYGERTPTYSWGYSTTEVDGQDYLLLYIDQTQSASYQRFTMPIDIVVDGETYVVFNDHDPQHFVIPISAAPGSVEFDPDAWILWSSVSSTSYVNGAPKIVKTDPLPGKSAIGLSVDTVSITFHTNVSTDAGDYTLVGASSGAQPFTFAYDGTTNTVTLTTDNPLPLDSYTLTVSDSVTGNGMALDGEMDDTYESPYLPSGDGVAGGSAVIHFQVSCGFGDGDCDGDVDLNDYSAFQLCFGATTPFPAELSCADFDFEDDGDVDMIDYARFSEKLGGPDPTDCNGNGYPDENDIELGFSQDCNENQIPDDCELTGNDCNNNGVPDECDVAIEDCNTNGIPDDCEPPVVAFSTTLDSDPGWSKDGLWGFGQPSGGNGDHGNPDPTSGYTGNNVFGYNLSGGYPDDMPEMHLTSTAINCTGMSEVQLSFWRWLGVEQPSYDHASVEVSNNGTNWTTVWENSEGIEDSSWQYMTLDISAIADDQPTVYLRWTMGSSDGSWNYCGWNIDDIEVTGKGCPPD